MIGIALAIFLTGMLIWKKCSGKQETWTPTLLAPPMPIPDLNPRPITYTGAFNKATKSTESISILSTFHTEILKLPKERERYWNNIWSKIIDEFN